MVFTDVAIYLSREEWDLLEEAQKSPYHSVMLENFALLSSLGKALTLTPGSWAGHCSSPFPYGQLCSPHSQTMGITTSPGFLVYVFLVPGLGLAAPSLLL